jgi:predicted transcriptional regulator
MKTHGITQQSLSTATGVHQSQVSRILSGVTKRLSKNVSKLVRYIDSLHNCIGKDAPIPSVLNEALRLVWDGSPEHADAIARVIVSLEGLSVAPPSSQRISENR